MKITQHTLARLGQRGITLDSVKLVIEFGTITNKCGGVTEYHLRRKDRDDAIISLKRKIQAFDKATNVAVVIGDDGKIITTYHKIPTNASIL